MGAIDHEHVSRMRRTGSIGAIFLTAFASLVIPTPVRVRANISVSAIDPTGRIAAGDKHTCAIALDDIIWCWGDNRMSQLGSSDFGDNFSLTPIQTTALPGSRVAHRIVAGANHTCVLATDETVWCWGYNGYGAVGVIGGNQPDPVQVTLGTGATMIAAGGSETCAVLSDNKLKCWGRNLKGQLGNGVFGSAAVPTPVYTSSVPDSFTVAHLEIGAAHSCAISALGVAWCWGDYASGRLGTSVQSIALNPTATASLGGTASHVAAGGAHTCVLLVIGTVTCFGSNSTGQIGLTPGTAPNPTPTAVTLETMATHVTAGEEFTCVLLTTAAVHCFGDNSAGQLGSGSIGSVRETPGAVTGLTGTVVDVIAGASHACAVMSTGQVRCWGLNDQGQLGIGSKVTAVQASAITSLNVVPTTTTTVAPITVAPTTTTTTTTTVPTVEEPVTVTSTTAEPVLTTTSISTSTNTTSTTTPTEPTTSTVALTKVAVPKATVLIHSLAMRSGSKMSAAKVAASVSMKIPRRSVGTMRISITKGKQYCAFAGTSLRAVRKGKCTIVVIYLPKKGPSVLRSNTLIVRK